LEKQTINLFGFEHKTIMFIREQIFDFGTTNFKARSVLNQRKGRFAYLPGDHSLVKVLH
jgi:hypothetical protein